MRKIWHNCLSIAMCLALCIGLCPSYAVAIDKGGEPSTAADSSQSSDRATEKETDTAPEKATDKAADKATDATDKANTTDTTAAKADVADKPAPKAAPSNGDVAPKAAPPSNVTYDPVTARRDVTPNLMNPNPVVKFQHPTPGGNYYTIEELKAQFGDDVAVYVGDSVYVHFQYKNLTNVQPNEGLYFPIPKGLKKSDITVEGDILESTGGVVGRYWIEGDNIFLQFSKEYLEENGGNVTDGEVNFYGAVSEEALEGEGISFGGIVISPVGGHVTEDPNQKAKAEKFNGLDKTEGTVYDADKHAEQFTITVDTTGNTKPVDVTLTDVITFQPANALDNNKAWTVDTDEAAAAGLTTSFTKTANGTYAWEIKQMPPNTKYKLTYWVYLDPANTGGDFSFTNTVTPSIGSQKFPGASTQGVEKHNYSVMKRAGTISYNPATKKATATYTLDVEANANNSGPGNCYLLDTFNTGGRTVKDVTIAEGPGSLSDKQQTDDTYSFKWNIGQLNPGQKMQLSYTAEFDPDMLFFAPEQDPVTVANTVGVYEDGDTNARSTSSTKQELKDQMAKKEVVIDPTTGAMRFTLVFNGKIPGTNEYFDSVLKQFKDEIQTPGFTYNGTPEPVLEAFNDTGYSNKRTLTDTGINGQTSFTIPIPEDMKGPYSYKLTYYVNIPTGADPSTIVVNKMSAEGVGIGGGEFSFHDTASGTVGSAFSADIRKYTIGLENGREGHADRLQYYIDVCNSLPAGSTITDTPSVGNNRENLSSVLDNGDMLDGNLTKVCIIDNQGNIKSTLARNVDYEISWTNNDFTIKFLKDLNDINENNRIRIFCQARLVPTEQQIQAMTQPNPDNNYSGIEWSTPENKAELKVNGLTASAYTAKDLGGKFKKEFVEYNPTTRLLKWEVSFPYEQLHLLKGERTITEQVSVDQTVVAVTDKDDAPIPFEVSGDGSKVTYKLACIDSSHDQKSYVYTKLNEDYLIAHGYDPDNLEGYQTKNIASCDGLGVGIVAQANATIDDTGTLVKDSNYTATTEDAGGSVEFTLTVNANAADLDPDSDTLTIQDTLNRSLMLDADSVRINGKTVAEFGQGAQLQYVEGSNNFKLILPDGVKCDVTYTGKIIGVVAGEDGWLTNTAQIEGRPGKATVDKSKIQRLRVGAGAYSAVPFFTKKLDGDGKLVSGATFELKRLELEGGQLVEKDAIDTDGNVIGSSNDNLDGTYRWINLIPKTPPEQGGKGYVYVVRETAAPTGCELNTTPKYIAFETPAQDMLDAMGAAGIEYIPVKGGGGNNIATMFQFDDKNLDDKVNVTVNKTWEDNDNSEGFRPQSIEFNLILDGNVQNPIDTVTVTDDGQGNWSHTFTDLPKYETVDAVRKEATYTVTETPINEYRTTISGSAADGYTVTNTHDVAKTSISGLKFWNDSSNIDGKRPDKITVGVFADDATEPAKTLELTNADASQTDPNYWAFKFDDLNKYRNDAKRTPIVYTVKEIGDAPAGYTATVGEAGNNYTVENKHDPDKIEVTFNKTWNDAENADGVRPTTIKVQLKADGINVGDPVEVTADEQGNWTHTFTDLTKSKLVDGTATAISYTVEEVDLDANYTAGEATYETSDEGNVTASITNTHELEKTELSGTKTWADQNNQDGKRPEGVKLGVFNPADMTTPVKTVDLSATDASAEDANVWNYKFTDLPKNKDGQAITYVVRELDAQGAAIEADGTNGDYKVTYDGNNITNSYTPDKIAISVTKAWEDDENRDGVRPAEVVVHLFADEVDTGKTLTLKADEGWKGSFTDLDVNKDGVKINYTITEDQVENYEAGVIAPAGDNAYTVTNKHEVEKTELSGTKTWADADNQDGKRLTTLKIGVFDQADMSAPVKTVDISAQDVSAEDANVWNYKFTDLPKNKDGQVITYVVRELDAQGAAIEADGTNGDYKVTYDGNNVTNTHEPEKTEIQGKKTWNDSQNQDGKRPQNIHVKVMNGTEVVAEKDVTGGETADTWDYSFTDLPKYKNGAVIAYTVEETAVAGYQTTYNGTEIVNAYTPGKVAVNVTKAWNDVDNQDGKRPESVTIHLFADGADTGKTLTLKADEGWKGSFTDLDEFSKGKKIVYTVTEDAVAEYTTSIKDTSENNYTVTNSHGVEKTSVTVTKAWNDRDNKEGKRPGTIDVQLKANGKNQGGPVQLTAEGNWTYTFEDLDTYAGGAAVEYTVAELKVDQYNTAVVTGDAAGGFTITNNETSRKVIINKVDNSGNLIAECTLKVTAEGGTDPIEEWTTAGEGHEMQLAPGKYVLTETAVAAGYEKAADISFTVNDDGTITCETNPATGDDKNVLSMVDEFTSHKVSVLKNDPADQGLAGAKLEISGKEASGKAIEAISWITDGNAHEVVLAMGDYTLRELEAPAGYEKFADIPFKVDAQGAVTVVDSGNTQAKVDENGVLVVTDKLVQSDKLFSKVNLGGEPVIGAQLTVTGTDAAGQAIEPISWTTGPEPHMLNLPMGTYVFHEEVAPKGYLAVTDITFKVDANGNVEVVSTDTNAMKVAEDGTVVITDELAPFAVKVLKVDENGDPLAGAELLLTGETAVGQAIDGIAWVSSTEAFVANLPAGKYVLSEKNVPDAQRYLPAADIAFEVTLEGAVVVDGKALEAATITMVDSFVPTPGGPTPIPLFGFLPQTGDVMVLGGALALLALAGVSGTVAALSRRKKQCEKQ